MVKLGNCGFDSWFLVFDGDFKKWMCMSCLYVCGACVCVCAFARVLVCVCVCVCAHARACVYNLNEVEKGWKEGIIDIGLIDLLVGETKRSFSSTKIKGTIGFIMYMYRYFG